ncbi:recombinase family protein [Pseudarthrobacter sulfonivorans]|uniref:recombinase family protein n=1 Tax=Pseudarthrobacter sulfonivorans TaxID=121292 RepID=UPI0027830381|nr:recombinase family protein [Pseudarthrobacter sulfonivorans]MDQ0000456.1 DNA invertase Pin-like site-specific DNA recombinase [Pseudarthrobacter sulfonivorans]
MPRLPKSRTVVQHPKGDPVAIYLRISSDRSGKEMGVQRQFEDSQKLADLHRLNVIRTIQDNDTSAYRGKRRKGFEELKKLAVDGKIVGIVAWDSDRLYRSMHDLEAMIEIVEAAPEGFTIHSVTSGRIDLNSSAGRAMARVMAGLGQYEVEHKAERQSRAQLQAFQEGRFPGGRVPIGYVLGDEPGTLDIDEPVAEVLRFLAAELISKRLKITSATRYFRDNTRHTKTKPVALRGVFLGPTIYAMRYYLPEVAKRRGVTSGTYRPAKTWKPILKKSQWNQLRVVLKSTPRGRPTSPSLLSGILHCGECGTKLGFSKATYKCSFTAGGCSSVSISTPAVERFLMQRTNAELSGNPHLLDGIQNDGAVSRVSRVIRDPDAELAALQKERTSLLNLQGEGLIDGDDIRNQLRRIVQQEAAIRAEGEHYVSEELRREQEATAIAVWDAIADDTSPEALRKKNIVIRAVLGEKIVIAKSEKGHRSGSKFNSDRVLLQEKLLPDTEWEWDDPNYEPEGESWKLSDQEIRALQASLPDAT